MDDRSISSAAEAGREAWPGVTIAVERFRDWLARNGVSDEILATRGSELYLAAACTLADARALDHFERAFLSQVERYVARVGLAKDLLDEVRQRLRVKLLAGPSPAIANYTGRGALGAWVRVSAVRIALDLSEALGSSKESDIQALGSLVSDRTSPELLAVKNRYRPMFQEALEASLAQLDAREKTLLRMHFIDGLNIDAIGRVYQVHRATVARWIVAVRKRVIDQLHTRFALSVSSNASEVRSIVQLFESEIQLSVQRLLGPSAGDGNAER